MKYWIMLLAVGTLAVLGFSLHEGIYAAREDSAGSLRHILFVSAAWTALLCFLVNFAASIWYLLVKRDPVIAPLVDEFAVASAEVGLVFCISLLANGPLWEKPAFVWSPRLTSSVVLCLIYISYLLARRLAHVEQTPIVAPVIAIVGFVYAPVAYRSINGWQLLSQTPGFSPHWTHLFWLNTAGFIVLATLWVFLRQQIGQAEQELHQSEVLKVLDASVQEVG